MNSIPGISHIIALKNAKNEKETFLTYDCVLCNDSKELLKGSAMKNHLNSRAHLMNVLEVESYALYENYKNDETVSVADLLKEIFSLESASKKRNVATAENHEAKRKVVALKISQLRKLNKEQFHSPQSSIKEKVDSLSPTREELQSESVQSNINESLDPASKKRKVANAENHEAKRKMVAMEISPLGKLNSEQFHSQQSSIKEEVNTLSATDKELQSESVQSNIKEVRRSPQKESTSSGIDSRVRELAKKQANRSPNRMVFVVDNKDLYIDVEPFEERLKLLRIFKLNFDGAVSYLEKNEALDRSSLIIMCCGGSSLISANAIKICKKMKCPDQLIKYAVNSAISADSLISNALKLQEEILNKTSSDQIMFCEIVPIKITNDVKRCQNNHSFQNDISQDNYRNYLKSIEEYNNFVKYHSSLMGFKTLDLLSFSFPAKEISLSVKGFNNLGDVNKENLNEKVTEFLINVFEVLKPNSVKPQKTHNNVPSTDSYGDGKSTATDMEQEIITLDDDDL